MPRRPASHKVINARYKRFSREMQAAADAASTQSRLIADGSDLPLFSGTPAPVQVQTFDPQPANPYKQSSLPGCGTDQVPTQPSADEIAEAAYFDECERRQVWADEILYLSRSPRTR